jgi:hypothetical protein
MKERNIARQLDKEIDLLLSNSPAAKRDRAAVYKDELSTAGRLHRWSQGLPPVPAALEQRVRAIVQSGVSAHRSPAWRPAALGALATAAVFVLIWILAPSSQQVWAEMLHALRLGQTVVELTPTLDAPTRAIREPLRDLVAAELLMGRAPSLPKELPTDYTLQEITAVSYPDLPSWISQPFFVELAYGKPGETPGLRLRQYRLLFREYGGIKGIQPASDLVASFEAVDVSGAPGTRLTFAHGKAKHTVIWERDGLLLELETDRLSPDRLLEVARTVR